MIFNPKAVVYHEHPDSLSKYLKQKFWRAYWRVLLYKKHPKKIGRESYTPQRLKLQIISCYLFILGLVLFPIISFAPYLSLLSLSLLIVLTLPLSYKIFRKEKILGLVSPFLLILRTFVFSMGLITGVLKI